MAKGNKIVSLLVVLTLVLSLVTTIGCSQKESIPSAPSGAKEPTGPSVPPGPQAVPVIPNDSIITGTVAGIRSVSGALPWEIDIQVQSSQDVQPLRNLTKQKIGETITVKTKENMAQLQIGQAISAHVKVVGDERGTFYLAWDIQVQ